MLYIIVGFREVTVEKSDFKTDQIFSHNVGRGFHPVKPPPNCVPVGWWVVMHVYLC